MSVLVSMHTRVCVCTYVLHHGRGVLQYHSGFSKKTYRENRRPNLGETESGSLE